MTDIIKFKLKQTSFRSIQPAQEHSCATISLDFSASMASANVFRPNIMIIWSKTIAVKFICIDYIQVLFFLIILIFQANKLPVNSTCSGSYQCNDLVGLQCFSGVCLCNSSQFYDLNFKNCSKSFSDKIKQIRM